MSRESGRTKNTYHMCEEKVIRQTPPPIPTWYLNKFNYPEPPDKECRWLVEPSAQTLEACRKLTEMSKQLKFYRHDN